MNTLQFSLVKKTRPVVLEDEKGNQVKWELREIKAEERDKYLTKISSQTRYNEDGNAAGMKSFDGLHAALLTRCLFQVEGEDAGKPVTEKQIKEWPASVVSALHAAAQELNSIDKEKKDGEEDAEKNE